MQELGLLCGTFNPVHWGHLLLAECARDQFQLEKVLFITNGIPPHRRSELLDAESRHLLVEAAVAGNPNFESCRMELDRPGPSYTVDTLLALRTIYGEGTRLNLIIGADNLPLLDQWHRGSEIPQLCRLLAAPRVIAGGQQPAALNCESADQVEMIDFPLVPISGSVIRERLRKGRSILYMVPPSVNELIMQKGFYRETSESTK